MDWDVIDVCVSVSLSLPLSLPFRLSEIAESIVEEKPVVPLVSVPSSEKSVLLSSENRSPDPSDEDPEEEDIPVLDDMPDVPLVLEVALVMELSVVMELSESPVVVL